MSTRGCIARVKGDGWEGVYHHWDSYPTCLGKELWQTLHGEYRGDIDAFLKEAIDQHPAGWSSYPDSCYCHDEYFAKRDGSIVKDSPYHKLDAPDGRMTQETADPLFIEWVYAFDAKSRQLSVFAHDTVSKLAPTQHGTFVEAWTLQHQDGSIEHIPAKYYIHKLVAVIDLDGEEPDWEAIQALEEY